MTDLHRYPLFRTNVALERTTFTTWAFFFHDSLPVLSFDKLQDRERCAAPAGATD
jgi:hypothetical protein